MQIFQNADKNLMNSDRILAIAYFVLFWDIPPLSENIYVYLSEATWLYFYASKYGKHSFDSPITKDQYDYMYQYYR